MINCDAKANACCKKRHVKSIKKREMRRLKLPTIRRQEKDTHESARRVPVVHQDVFGSTDPHGGLCTIVRQPGDIAILADVAATSLDKCFG